MRLIIGLLLGIIITVAAIWFFGRGADSRDARGTLGRAGEELREGAEDVVGRVREGIGGIDSDGIRENMREGGRRITDASADAVITGKVKARFATDSELSVWKIGVDTTDGRVTLSGTVSSQGQIDRAVELAGGVEGVRQVVSTLQIQKSA
jgi:osmotically-inducible protein OsmY